MTKKNSDKIYKSCCVTFYVINFSFYMILGGKISIYILNKEKNEEGDETVPLDQIGTRNEKGQLDRSKLGTFVTYLGKEHFTPVDLDNLITKGN